MLFMMNTIAEGKLRCIQLLKRRCNVFLLSLNDRHLLVDTNRRKYRPHLIRALEELHITRIDYLILTHTHFDHAENAAFIREQYGAKVIVHESEADFLAAGDSPIPRGSLFLTAMITSMLPKRAQKIFKYEPCPVDIRITDNFDLSPLGFPARLAHTPGHSRGSISIIMNDKSFALVGDMLFGKFSGSAFPPFADDIPQLKKSWEVLLDSGCPVFYPAHGKQVTRELLERESRKPK
jgi:glyoxylase-like metal-dependent hydrolase (beta-lactamase superfamily II)